MKLKKRKKNKLLVICLLILLGTIIILNYIGNKITPQAEEIIKANVNKSINSYVFYIFSRDTLSNEKLMDIVDLNMNSNQEVISIDYQFNKVYKYLGESVFNFFKGQPNMNIEYYDWDKEVFFLPVGMMHKNNILINGMGFKIPIKVKILTDVNLSFKTKVSDYGLNNVLVELYIVVNVANEMLTSGSLKQFGETYEIVVASKVVMGKVPMYYGGSIEKSSSILSS